MKHIVGKYGILTFIPTYITIAVGKAEYDPYNCRIPDFDGAGFCVLVVNLRFIRVLIGLLFAGSEKKQCK